MAFIQYHQVVQTISPDATDQSFGVRILPRASRCGEHLFDTHALDPSVEKYSYIHSVLDTWETVEYLNRVGLIGYPRFFW